MTATIYRYLFPPAIPLEEVEGTIVLAAWGVEALHGETQARLDAGHLLDRAARTCVVDAGTPAGRDFNRLFAGYLAREFGADSFRVERPGVRREGSPATA